MLEQILNDMDWEETETEGFYSCHTEDEVDEMLNEYGIELNEVEYSPILNRYKY